jgi:hypothetical protein
MGTPGSTHSPGALGRSYASLAEESRDLFDLFGSARREVLAPEAVDVAVANPGQTPRRLAVTRRGIGVIVTILVERVFWRRQWGFRR